MINKKQVTIHYNLPMPPEEVKQQPIGVLPIGTPGGPYGTVPELFFEKKELIPSLQKLIVTYSRLTG